MNIEHLLCDEYEDFADEVLIEGPFILVSPHSSGVQHVKAAITPDKLIIAILMQNENEASVDMGGAGINPDSEELELMKLIPLPFVTISVLDKKRKRIQVQLCNNDVIYLEFHEDGPHSLWKEWGKTIDLLQNRHRIENSPFKLDPKLESLAKNAIKTSKKKLKKKKSRRGKKIDARKTRKKSEHTKGVLGILGEESDESDLEENRKSGGKSQMLVTKIESENGLNEIGDVEAGHVGAAQKAARARWRKVAIGTRFVFRKSRKVSFGAVGLLALGKSSYQRANGLDGPLHRIQSMTALDVQDFASKGMRKSTSLPLVFDKEVTFLESRPSSQGGLVENNNNVEGSVSFIRCQRFTSVDHCKMRRPSFIPPRDSQRDSIERRSSNESITKVFEEVEYQSKIFLASRPEEDTFHTSTDTPKKRQSILKRVFSPIHSKDRDSSTKKDRHSLPLPEPSMTTHRHSHDDSILMNEEDFGNVRFEVCTPMSSKGYKYDQDTMRKNMIYFVLSLNSLAVAKELTMIVKKLFFNIPSAELNDCLWTKKDKYTRAPNIMTMIDFFERIANLVATQILYGETVQERAKLCRKFISIAEKCHQIQNFNSLRSILGGLQITPVYRIEKTWNHVMSKYPKKYRTFQELSDLMSHEDNFDKYRSALDKAAENPPCMPFIGVFLQTVLALDTAKDVTGYKKKKQAKTRLKTVVPDNTRDHDSDVVSTPESRKLNDSPGLRRQGSVIERAKEKVFELFHDVHVHHLDREKDSIQETEEIGEQGDNNSAIGAGSRHNSGQRHGPLPLFECSDEDMSDDASKKPAFLQIKPKDMLFHYQIAALPYNYPSNPSIRDFLLHAEYLPDDENYKISLQREPIER